MKNFRIFNTLFLLAITSVIAIAQDISFKAEANKNTVTVGDNVQVGFFIESDIMDYSIEKPMRYPDHNGFRIIGEEKTQQVQYINGKAAVQDGIIIVFQPEKEGKLKIGSARITINGKNYATKPIEIDVVKANSTTNRVYGNEPAFLQASVSNTNPYVNEQVNLTVKMYAQDLSLLNRKRNLRQGKLDGLSPKMVSSRPESIKQEMVSGKQYFSEEVTKYVLFPEKEGRITIDPFSVDILVSGIYGTESYEIRSNPVVINAKPIPEEGRPKNFTGAVGEFKLKTEVNKNEVRANESANLKLEISGTGNFNKLVLPDILTPKNIETYTPKRHNNFKTYEDGMQGSIASEIIMVPEEEGSYTISPVEFSYFDPKKEEFITLRTDEFKLSVNGVAKNNKDDNNDDDENNEDKKYIASEDNSSSILTNKWLLAGGSFAALIAVSLIFIRRKKDNSSIDIESNSENKNQNYMPKTKLADAEFITNQTISQEGKISLKNKLDILQQNIHNPDTKVFYQLQEDLLCQIGMKLTQTDLANFSDYSVGEKLIFKGWNKNLVEEWRELLSKARQAKYSALNISDDDLTEIYFNTEKLIKQFLK